MPRDAPVTMAIFPSSLTCMALPFRKVFQVTLYVLLRQNHVGSQRLTGTVAGAITLRATFQAEGQNITPTVAPSRVTRLLRSAPVIRSVEVTKSGSSFEIIVRGFSNPRQVTQATFRFTAASGANLQTLELTLPMTALSDQWFQGQDSQQFGGQFTLRQAFTVQGDIRAISAVSVVLSNAVGASQPSSTPF
jgi:hypothetical protein